MSGILIIEITFLFFLHFTFGVFESSVFTPLLLTLVFNIILFLFLGYMKKNEEEKIISVINLINENKFDRVENIKFGSNINRMEESLKLLAGRKKMDIQNVKKLEQVRKEFLANVSHELRTPIFAIEGFLETLLRGAINDKKVNKNFVSKAMLHSKNLDALLNDLIDISMMESGQMRLRFGYFSIKTFLEELVSEFFPIAEDRKIKIILHPVRSGLKLYGDKLKLKQVFSNLVSNAIKYNNKGIVEIQVEEEPDFGKMIIRDSGYGISESDLERIFERFYRVDKDRSREMGGTGLGLAIVKHIIEAHNSKIEVKSELGKGTEFSFRLKK